MAGVNGLLVVLEADPELCGADPGAFTGLGPVPVAAVPFDVASQIVLETLETEFKGALAGTLRLERQR